MSPWSIAISSLLKPEVPPIVPCAVCGTEFALVSKQNSYCSRKCLYKAAKMRKREASTSCAYCGEMLPSDRKKFCSNRCSISFRNLRWSK